MPSVSSTDFQRNPGPYQDTAMREPVTITAYGRDRLVLLSAEEYARLKRIDDILAGRQKPASPQADPLGALFARLHAKVETDGLTAEDIEAELSAYNAKRRR
jgi:prevent-host-death family protein